MTRWLMVNVVLAALALGASLYVWNFAYEELPAQVPTHWNAKMEPDQFTPREDMLGQLLLVPGMLTGWVILTLVLPWLSPRPFSMEEWRPTYEYAMATAAGLMAYIQFLLLGAWLELWTDFGRWFLAGMFLFFALLGNILGKVRRNFYVGIRTPWTIASEVVWERTHRLAAWLFTGGGLLGFVLVGVLDAPWWIGVIILLVAVIYPVVYSLVLSKRLEREGDVKTPAPT